MARVPLIDFLEKEFGSLERALDSKDALVQILRRQFGTNEINTVCRCLHRLAISGRLSDRITKVSDRAELLQNYEVKWLLRELAGIVDAHFREGIKELHTQLGKFNVRPDVKEVVDE